MSDNVQPPPLRMLIFALIYVLIFPALLLLLSGDWLWVEGWVFTVWFLVLCYAAIFYIYRHDPALLAERYKQPGSLNQAGWDRYVVYALVLGFLAWIILMPLDARRFQWTTAFPLWLKGLGLVTLLFSAFFIFRSYVDNTFLSPLVRVQSDRQQQVVSTGVYGFVRHPMYLGGTLLFIGVPLLLGSAYGLALGLALVSLVMGRIIGEERLLVQELEGYAEYRSKVKYRLIPFIW